MDVMGTAKTFLGRYAIALVKRNPKLIISQIENLFANSLRDATLEAFVEGVEKEADLVEMIPPEEMDRLRSMLTNKDAVEIYRRALKPAITDYQIMEWLRIHRPDLWSYCMSSRPDPTDARSKSKAELYIINMYRRGIAVIDALCREVEGVGRSESMPEFRAKEYEG